MIQLAIIYSRKKLTAKLCKFFTGEYAYHCGFVDFENDTFYDMYFTPRKVSWKAKKYKDVTLHPTILNASDCEEYLKQDSLHMVYSLFDYWLFAIRPIYHLIGKSTPNANGIICSEMCNNWLWRKKPGITPFNPLSAPPSPADFVRLYRKGK